MSDFFRHLSRFQYKTELFTSCQTKTTHGAKRFHRLKIDQLFFCVLRWMLYLKYAGRQVEEAGKGVKVNRKKLTNNENNNIAQVFDKWLVVWFSNTGCDLFKRSYTVWDESLNWQKLKMKGEISFLKKKLKFLLRPSEKLFAKLLWKPTRIQKCQQFEHYSTGMDKWNSKFLPKTLPLLPIFNLGFDVQNWASRHWEKLFWQLRRWQVLASGHFWHFLTIDKMIHLSARLGSS